MLAATLYDNLCLRPFGDLDILVPRRDISRARDLLLANGYEPLTQRSAAQEAAHLEHHGECQLIGHRGKVVVELQWRITPAYWQVPSNQGSFLLDPERLWDRLETVSLGGDVVRHFRPEELLLILCVHGAKHAWSRLIWLCDVAALLRARPDMDWPRVLEQARETNSERMLLLGLFLAERLLGAPLPDVAARALHADPALPALAEPVTGWLFRSGDGEPGHREKSRFHLGLRGRLRDRLRYGRVFVRKTLTLGITD